MYTNKMIICQNVSVDFLLIKRREEEEEEKKEYFYMNDF